MVTAETKIRIRPSHPPLTKDTRIKLSQIKDLTSWIKDRKYQNGDISEKTGLMRVAPSKWVEPNHEQEMSVAAETDRQNLVGDYIKGHYPDGKPSLEQFAEDTGSKIYNETDTDELSKFITSGTKKLKYLTGGTFSAIMITESKTEKGTDGKDIEKGIIARDTLAQVNTAYPGVMMINKSHPYWKSKKEREQVLKSASTNNPYHVFFHEMAHLTFHPKKKNIEKKDKLVALSLSDIATQTASEYCAEYYAKTRLGYKTTKEQDKLFKELTGE